MPLGDAFLHLFHRGFAQFMMPMTPPRHQSFTPPHRWLVATIADLVLSLLVLLLEWDKVGTFAIPQISAEGHRLTVVWWMRVLATSSTFGQGYWNWRLTKCYEMCCNASLARISDALISFFVCVSNLCRCVVAFTSLFAVYSQHTKTERMSFVKN